MSKGTKVLLVFVLTFFLFNGLVTINGWSGIDPLQNSPLRASFTMDNAIDISSTSTANDYQPSIAMDSNGKIHVAFYDSNNILYYTSSVNNFATLTTVASGGGTPFESPRIFIDSNNYIHIFYGIVVGPERTLWYVNNSVGVFAPHINLTKLTGVKSLYSNFDVAIDSTDIFHVVSMDDDEVYYFSIRHGSCSAAELLSIDDSYTDGIPCISVGQYIMTAWYWYGGILGGEIMVRCKIPGLSWGIIDNVTKTPGIGNLDLNPGIVIDKTGVFHILFENCTNSAHLSYCNNKEKVLSFQNFDYPWVYNTRNVVKVDSNSAIHAMWYNNKFGDDEIFYITNVNGSFSYYNLTSNNYKDRSPDFVIDSNNNLHLVYYSNRTGNYDIYYQKIIYEEITDGGGIPGWTWLFIIPPFLFATLVFLYRRKT